MRNSLYLLNFVQLFTATNPEKEVGIGFNDFFILNSVYFLV